ncbi:enoyl-CoA hydratase-related protein [Colwellia hornerae]|uniref:Enoyl-CoA hydratase n=1 Tax=Colwellia hornerae TaxID=89402 RepID=A0A5C6QN83_9GAMM|nr:enoyl-CoA hydratase-related protein [Colwellia hornerae]TWX53722.1 enoyl-CoA hydratase [Colwellia hornerae]TWX60372.1 enoyl-CoA hydratase [Colwellia hornerae]TWX70128.1 enoyl-CoA hydratase [Colwellia hornerae]
MNEQQDILIHKEHGVLQIGINRPAKKNALTSVMYAAMAKALQESVADETINVVLIHGTQAAFSAGNDLNDFNNRDVNKPSPAAILLDELHHYPKPIVGAVSGFAIGIGVTMLLHFDLVYASETYFKMPFVDLGVCPEGGSSLLIPQLAGHRKAAEILMLGDAFNTATAISLGIVNQQIAKLDVFDFALSKAKALALKPQNALRTTKKMLKATQQTLVGDVIKNELVIFAALLNSDESIVARTKK